MNSRERLLVLMYETKDPAKKAAIEKRIKAMDKERADRKSTAVTDTLDVPLKMLRKSLSGNEDEWFGPVAETTPGGVSFSLASAEWGIPALSEDANVLASDFAGGVTDVLADPLNLVGPGLYAKGAKAVNKIAGKGAGKGMLTAPADNYIDNFYVPRESGENTLLEKAAKPILSKTKQGKNLNPEQMVGASQRAVSTGKTVAKAGLNSAADLMDPRARALWKKENVSQTGQEIITKHMDDYAKGTGNRPLAKAGAEAIYQGHQRWQGGGTINPDTALGKFLDKAFLQQYTKMEPNTLKNIFKEHHATKKMPASKKGQGAPVVISDNDAEFMQKLVMDDWPGTNSVVVKRPEATESGKHLFDLIGPKSPAMSAYKKAQKSLPKGATNDQLAAALEKVNKTNSVNKRFPIKVIRDKDGGVWVSSTRPGTAIVEGGYRAFHKVEPDGKFFAVMSDEHDFLEKTPVLGKAVGEYLPNKLLAVTPPIHGDVTKRVAYDQAGAARRYEKGDTMANDLKKITELTPDKELVKAEATKQAGLMAPVVNESFIKNEEEPTND